jgi:hypothetical protein
MFPSSFPLSLILLLNQLSLPYHPRLKTNHVYNNVLFIWVPLDFCLDFLWFCWSIRLPPSSRRLLVGPPRLIVTPLLTTSLTVVETTVAWKTEKAPDLVDAVAI